MLAAPFHVVAGLLVVGGASKLRHPAPAVRALSAAGVPGGRVTARALGTGEVGVGALCLVTPLPAFAAALALLYLSFAAFLAAIVAGRVRSPSCGCLGERDVPPSRLHVFLDLTAAAVALLAIAWPPPGLFELMSRLPLLGIPFAVGVALAGYLSYLAVSYLPHLFFSYRGGGERAAAVDGGAQ